MSAQRLASEAVLATLMTYLAGYRTFTNEEQPKRLVALMHRQAVKAKAEGLFFKVRPLAKAFRSDVERLSHRYRFSTSFAAFWTTRRSCHDSSLIKTSSSSSTTSSSASSELRKIDQCSSSKCARRPCATSCSVLMRAQAFFPHRRGEISKMMRGEDPTDGESDGEEPTVRQALLASATSN